MKKIKSKSGESITEVLVATLIVSMAFMILAGGIVSAARVSGKLRNEDVSFSVQEKAETGIQVTVTDGMGQALPMSGSVQGYMTKMKNGGYYYYEYTRETEENHS